MEFISDYDFTIQYRPGKANVVADALSRKLHGLRLAVKENELIREVTRPEFTRRKECLDGLMLKSEEEIREKQPLDEKLELIRTKQGS